jgi:hypothetical protein
MLCNYEDYQPIAGFYSCVFFGSEQTDRPMFCLLLRPGPSASGNREAPIVIFSGSATLKQNWQSVRTEMINGMKITMYQLLHNLDSYR